MGGDSGGGASGGGEVGMEGTPFEGRSGGFVQSQASGGAGVLPGLEVVFRAAAARTAARVRLFVSLRRRRVPARSPGLGGQEGKFDQAVGEERETLLGDAGNLQPVL